MRNQILPAVAAAIFNGKGEIGEAIEAAMLREIEEETNVKGKIKRFIGIYSSPDSPTYNYADSTVQYVTSYFEAELTAAILPGFSNNETQELKFVSVHNIPFDLALMRSNWLEDALTKNKPVFIR
jgi:8-oxo-dGTP diphosphatase